MDGSSLERRSSTQEAQLFEVRRFWEKPPAETTRAIWNAGAHRNSFILVAKVSALLSLILKTLPRLHGAFHSVRPVLGTMFEGRTIESLYRDLPRMEFSQRVLARSPQALAVLAVSNLEWSDLGDPQRVLSLLKRIAQTRTTRTARKRHPGSLPANARRRLGRPTRPLSRGTAIISRENAASPCSQTAPDARTSFSADNPAGRVQV